MATNIVDLVARQLGAEAFDAVRNVTGLEPHGAQAAVEGAVPAVLAAIVGALTTAVTSAGALDAVLEDQEPDVLGNLRSRLSNGRRLSLLTSGIQSMVALLGEHKVNRLGAALGEFAGISQTDGKTVMGLIAPAALGVIAQYRRERKLGANGVIGMLAGQRRFVARALPTDLAALLSSAGLLDELMARASGAIDAPDTARAAAAPRWTAMRARPPRPGHRPWVLAAGVAAIVSVGWLITRGVDRDATAAARGAADGASPPASRVPLAAADGFRVGNIDLAAEFGGIADDFGRAIGSVTNRATAEAALPKVSELSTRLEALAPLTQDLPPAARSAFRNVVQRSIGSIEAQMNRVNALPELPDSFVRAVTLFNEQLATLLTAAPDAHRG